MDSGIVTASSVCLGRTLSNHLRTDAASVTARLQFDSMAAPAPSRRTRSHPDQSDEQAKPSSETASAMQRPMRRHFGLLQEAAWPARSETLLNAARTSSREDADRTDPRIP